MGEANAAGAEADAKDVRITEGEGGALVGVRLITKQDAGTGRAIANEALGSQAFELEDEFAGLYFDHAGSSNKTVLQPPYHPRHLRRVVKHNNTLNQAVTAMEVNIAGTGWVIERIDDEEVDDNHEEVRMLRDFLREPFPGVSWTTIKRRLRRDLEEVGNAYLEVLRNAQDEVTFVNRVEPTTMRLVKLDEPVRAKRTVMRSGALEEVQVMVRERRFAQSVGTHVVYFKEFGASRDVNRETGLWFPLHNLKFNERGTEIIHFTVHEDTDTPYGVPRWINQTPSVIGSREAEELNLEFFQSGGVPPLIITVSGGALAEKATEELKRIFSGKAKHKLMAGVLEAYSTSGSLEGGGQVKIDVHSYGSSDQKDSQFENYDEKCARRIRGSFRLPPIFVGLMEDYSFACYDEGTETLTDHGWIRWDQYRPGMRVATYNRETRGLEYKEPHGPPLVYDVDGVEMYRFRGQSLDMMVTPRHRMLYTTQHGAERLEPIESMTERCTRPRFVSRVDRYDEGTAIEWFAPPWVPLRGGSNVAYDRVPARIPAEDFLSLLGWYLSEGSLLKQGSAFKITQNPGAKWDEIEGLCRRLESVGYAMWWDGPRADGMRGVSVADNSLYWWVRRECGGKSHEKRVPALIRLLPKEQLAVFFDALMAGDGTMDHRPDRSSGAYATTSRGLADDVQEIAVKLGYRAKLIEGPPGTEGIRPVYRVLLSKGARAGGEGRLQSVRYEEHLTREWYTGKVYCFSVPNGVFVTRRNGVVAVQGNTAFASYIVAEAQVFDPEREEDDEIINTKLVRAMGVVEHRVRSLPLSINDVANQLLAVQIAIDNGSISKEDLVETLNEVAGLSLKFTEMELMEEEVEDPDDEGFGVPGGASGRSDPSQGESTPGQQFARKEHKKRRRRRQWQRKEDPLAIARLAREYLRAALGGASDEETRDLRAKVESLGPQDRALLDNLMVSLSMPGAGVSEDLDRLTGCAARALTAAA